MQTFSDKTDVSVDMPYEQLVSEGHSKLEELLHFVGRCTEKGDCQVCGKSCGWYRLINPEEAFVDNICDDCKTKYSKSQTTAITK